MVIKKKAGNVNPYRNTWELERLKRYEFPIVVKNSRCKKISRVHPLKQGDVSNICDILATDERVANVIVFGSSLNMRCNIHSDLDICISLKDGDVSLENKNEISEALQKACNWNLDILWSDRINETERIYEDIKSGVVIL